MNAPDRLPLMTRLLHPRYAREVAFLAAEHRRAGLAALPADRRSELELASEVGGHAVAQRRVTRTARRLGRLTRKGALRVQRARGCLAVLDGADDREVLLAGRAVTVAEARSRVAVLAKKVDADPHPRRLDRDSRPLRFVGVGLLLIDAVALVIIFGFLLNIDWNRPDAANLITTIALSLFGAAVQAVLALHLGRRLWAWRHSDPAAEDAAGVPEFPPRSLVVVLGGGLLALVSTFAAGAIFLRVRLEGVAVDAEPVAVALGLVLAASALAAPWCLVADEAYGPSPDARLLQAASRAVARADAHRSKLERQARRHLGTATRMLGRAECMLADAVHRIGRDHVAVHQTLLVARGLAWGTTVFSAADLRPPGGREEDVARSVLPMVLAGDHRCLTVPVNQLRNAVAAARADYACVVDRIDPGDLDLAR